MPVLPPQNLIALHRSWIILSTRQCSLEQVYQFKYTATMRVSKYPEQLRAEKATLCSRKYLESRQILAQLFS